jgi:hypothetical protein
VDGIRASQESQRVRVPTATGSVLRSRNCQMLSSRLRPPAAGLAGVLKAEPLSGLGAVPLGSLGMVGADRFAVADLGGVSDALACIKGAVAALSAAGTGMDSVEAVLGDRSGVDNDPGFGSELLHGQSPYRDPANGPSTPPA